MSVRRHRIRPSAKPRGTVHPACQASLGCALGAMPLIIKTINSTKCRDSAPVSPGAGARASRHGAPCSTSSSSSPNLLDIKPVPRTFQPAGTDGPRGTSLSPRTGCPNHLSPTTAAVDAGSETSFASTTGIRIPHGLGRDHSRPVWSNLLHRGNHDSDNHPGGGPSWHQVHRACPG